MSGYDDFFKKARHQSHTRGAVARPKTSPKQQLRLDAAAANAGDERVMAALRMKRKKPTSFPWRFVGISVFGFLIAGAGLIYLEDVDSLLDRVEVSVLGIAAAQDEGLTGKQDPPTSQLNKKTKEKVQTDPLESKVSKAPWSEEDINHLQHLKNRKNQLDEREKDLQKLESEIAQQKDEVQAKLAELQKVRDEIATLLKDRVEADDEKVDKLVEFYSNMKPQMSSKIFETLDEDLAVEVLGRMKKKSAAEIMNLLSPEKAQTLSEKFAGYQVK